MKTFLKTKIKKIYLAKIKFNNCSEFSVRPVVVLKKHKKNFVVANITSQRNKKSNFYQLPLLANKKNNLFKNSFVKYDAENIFELTKNNLIKEVGVVDNHNFKIIIYNCELLNGEKNLWHK